MRLRLRTSELIACVRPALAALTALLPLLGSCSGGEGRSVVPGTDVPLPPLPPPGTDLPVDEAEAVRFLTRATFGPNAVDRAALQQVGFSAWIDWQLQLPTSEALAELERVGCAPEIATCKTKDYDPREHSEHRHRHFWTQAVWGSDQLRQRVAWALSQIFVVSESNDELAQRPVLLADYSDMLQRNAFGTYRDLLEEVTLHPAMGVYLSMASNRKEDPIANTRPDENFAREVMQLFSIGLFELNERGETILDLEGKPIPTYDQDVIQGMARALTGWTFAGDGEPSDDGHAFRYARPRLGRMRAWPAFHETGAKVLLGGHLDPGGASAEEDLATALDLLADHPNVGPFIGRQLVQRLVTSNPSGDYVARVAAVWADDGNGTRGNLEAVVRAILLDPEALGGTDAHPAFGKLREPMLRATALWRAFEAERAGNAFDPGKAFFFNQAPLAAPSVFNFYRPTFTTQELSAQGLVAPELQITTHSFVTRVGNHLGDQIWNHNAEEVPGDYEGPVLPTAELRGFGSHPAQLVEVIDVRLFGGTMSSKLRSVLREHAKSFDDELQRALAVLHLAVLSPEFAVQK